MDISIRIAFLESRLHRLSTRKSRDNAWVCRKISREIRNLRNRKMFCFPTGTEGYATGAALSLKSGSCCL